MVSSPGLGLDDPTSHLLMVVSCAIPGIFICSWGRWGRINCKLRKGGWAGKPLPLRIVRAELAAASCSGPGRPALQRAGLDGLGTSFHTTSPLPGLLRKSTEQARGNPARPDLALGTAGHLPAGAAKTGRATPALRSRRREWEEGRLQGTRPRGADEALLLAASPPRPGGSGNWLQQEYFFFSFVFALPSPSLRQSLSSLNCEVQRVESPAGSAGPDFR